MAINHDDLKKAAHQTFLRLKDCFEKSRNFWRLGHSFDTVLDYFITTSNADGEAAGFANIALAKYAGTHGSWFDDYAWWAIANLRAAQQKQMFGLDAEKFYDNAIAGWAKMSPCVAVWDSAQHFSQLSDAKPAVDGGAWNHPYEPAADSKYNPLGPKADPLAGYQNTVTNALYFLLAARLSHYAAPVDPKFTKAMDREYQFLQEWFHLDRPGMEPLLNVFPDAPDKAVVRERVGYYASGKKVGYYRSNLAWAGDQGLILGGLMERMQLVKKDEPSYPAMLSVVRQILRGTREYLAVNGQLLPWWPDPAPGVSVALPRGDGEDYRTGVAVFMRNLLSTYLLNNEDLRQDFSAYSSLVYANAARVLQSPAPAEDSVDARMVSLTNDLAILTAALVIA